MRHKIGDIVRLSKAFLESHEGQDFEEYNKLHGEIEKVSSDIGIYDWEVVFGENLGISFRDTELRLVRRPK